MRLTVTVGLIAWLFNGLGRLAADPLYFFIEVASSANSRFLVAAIPEAKTEPGGKVYQISQITYQVLERDSFINFTNRIEGPQTFSSAASALR